jgi:hypothetical protein
MADALKAVAAYKNETVTLFIVWLWMLSLNIAAARSGQRQKINA